MRGFESLILCHEITDALAGVCYFFIVELKQSIRSIRELTILCPMTWILPDLARFTDNLQKAGVESSFCFLDGIPPNML